MNMNDSLSAAQPHAQLLAHGVTALAKSIKNVLTDSHLLAISCHAKKQQCTDSPQPLAVSTQQSACI